MELERTRRRAGPLHPGLLLCTTPAGHPPMTCAPPAWTSPSNCSDECARLVNNTGEDQTRWTSPSAAATPHVGRHHAEPATLGAGAAGSSRDHFNEGRYREKMDSRAMALPQPATWPWTWRMNPPSPRSGGPWCTAPPPPRRYAGRAPSPCLPTAARTPWACAPTPFRHPHPLLHPAGPRRLLYARTTGWEDLALLPGDANVFFEGTYVGRTHLDLSRPQDTP